MHKRTLVSLTGGVVLTLVWSLLTALPVSAQATFSDQTLACGLDHSNFMAIDTPVRQHYPGGTVGDFNKDGWPDLFLLGGGGIPGSNEIPDALFINNQDGTFTDRAADWGVDLIHRGYAATAGDFNKDGWQDLYVTSGGDMTAGPRPAQHLLYKNNGDGTFTNVAASAGVNWTSDTWLNTMSPTFGDYDLDGDLDLFVCTWGNGNDANRLFRNNGDETFTDVTDAAGIDRTPFGFSPLFADMDGDRYPELLLAADAGTSQYYVNNQDGTFTNQTASSGTGLDSNGMGHCVADINHDGLLDWYVTSIYRDLSFQDGNYLYVNQGNHVFTHLPESAGVTDGAFGWGTDARDFDHDGWVDLAETNGWPPVQFQNNPSFLYRNNGDLTFTEIHEAAGFDHTMQGRALLTLDFDRDGDMEIVITSFNDPVKLFRNDLSGPDTNWLEIFVDTSLDPSLAPDGFGTRIIATTGTTSQYYYLGGGATYLGQSQLVAHFGLGAATVVDQLTFEWANGNDTVLTNVAANQILTVSAPATAAPGEASSPSGQMLAGFNPTTDMIDITYTPACDATDHTIYYGDLANVSNYVYLGAECLVGTDGSASFDPGLDNSFYLVVGNNGTVEGPYGEGEGVDRPEDTGTVDCDFPKDLTGSCP